MRTEWLPARDDFRCSYASLAARAIRLQGADTAAQVNVLGLSPKQNRTALKGPDRPAHSWKPDASARDELHTTDACKSDTTEERRKTFSLAYTSGYRTTTATVHRCE
jgi:hypothetical protein